MGCPLLSRGHASLRLRRVGLLRKHSLLSGPHGKLGPSVQVQLVEDPGEVHTNGSFGDHKLMSDLSIGTSEGDERCYFELAASERHGRGYPARAVFLHAGAHSGYIDSAYQAEDILGCHCSTVSHGCLKGLIPKMGPNISHRGRVTFPFRRG